MAELSGRTLLITLLALAACHSEPKKTAHAPKLAPPPPSSAIAVPVVAPLPPQSTEVSFMSEGHKLQGFITKPNGTGPFPAMIFNHGSEQYPKQMKSLRDWFVAHGYVFFLPMRSGHGSSQGPYVMDQVKRSGDRQSATVRVLEHQVEDVGNAFKFLTTQPYVDKGKVAVSGGSYGGIETLFAAERDLGFKAAIDWAGDAESWKNQTLKQRLLKAVDRAKIPIFFLQAENDFTTEPTRVFGAEAARMNKPHKAKIFPVYGDPNSHEDGHAGFTIKGGSVWGNDVLAFLQQYMK